MLTDKVIYAESLQPKERAEVLAIGLERYVQDIYDISRSTPAALMKAYDAIEHARALLSIASEKISVVEQNSKALHDLCGTQGSPGEWQGGILMY